MKLCIVDNLTNLKSKPYDIFSMSLVTYNANTSGNNVGDCVCRAISIAFNINYNDVRKYLNRYKKELRESSYKTQYVFSHVIEELGGSSSKTVSGKITVEDFVDSHDDSNAYILVVGKPNNHPSHLVACRGDNLFDSWDCSQYVVYQYYVVYPSCFGVDLELTDIKDYLKQFVEEDIQDCLIKNFIVLEDKWFKKYVNNKYEIDEPEEEVRVKNYLVLIPLIFRFKQSNGSWKEWKFKIAYSFTPYMTYEQGVQFIEEQTKKRLYEKLYSIHKQIDEYEEEYAQMQEEDVQDTTYWGYDVSAEEKFLNTLPAWVQLRCKSIDIQQARGRGYRSKNNYRLVCTPLSGDTNKEDIEFYGPTADSIKQEIIWYKDDFLRPGEDYGVDYDGVYTY